jgi:hypothetical protein
MRFGIEFIFSCTSQRIQSLPKDGSWALREPRARLSVDHRASLYVFSQSTQKRSSTPSCSRCRNRANARLQKQVHCRLRLLISSFETATCPARAPHVPSRDMEWSGFAAAVRPRTAPCQSITVMSLQQVDFAPDAKPTLECRTIRLPAVCLLLISAISGNYFSGRDCQLPNISRRH